MRSASNADGSNLDNQKNMLVPKLLAAFGKTGNRDGIGRRGDPTANLRYLPALVTRLELKVALLLL